MEKLWRSGSLPHQVILCLVGVRMAILAIVSLWIILQERDLPELLLWTILALFFAQFIDFSRKVKKIGREEFAQEHDSWAFFLEPFGFFTHRLKWTVLTKEEK